MPHTHSHRFAHALFPCTLSALWLAACATTAAPVRREEGSAKEHDQQAAHETREARRDDAAYDPSAVASREHCRPLPEDAAGGVADVGGACWTSVSNPTEHFRDQATAHRRHAAEHREASASLRQAEARACTGIRADDRDISPFDRSDDITSVEPLLESSGTKTAPTARTAGATIGFRAVPGMSVQWMQHVVDCHLARNATFAGAMTHLPNCPLVPKGVEARVAAAPGGFSIAVRSNDDAIARDVLARANRARVAR